MNREKQPMIALKATCRWVASSLLLACSAYATELPLPEKLVERLVSPAVAYEVVEPHESGPQVERRVAYRGFPIEAVLTELFGGRWQSPDTEVVFLSRDGYRAAIPTARFGSHRAYLSFARQDGLPFVVDNLRQNEKEVALGPYYLIWDNRDDPVLRRAGDEGWPYQITRIELASTTDYQAIQPPNPSAEVTQGWEYFKRYCLTCHRIENVGGEKYPGDLRQSLCNLNKADIRTWIENPARMRPQGTTMPSLDPMLPENERSRITDRIMLYLDALESDNPVCRTSPATRS